MNRLYRALGVDGPVDRIAVVVDLHLAFAVLAAAFGLRFATAGFLVVWTFRRAWFRRMFGTPA